jgi:hypothetical protein
MGVGDPHLLAVELPVVAAVGGRGSHAGDVGAGVGLGHGEKAHGLGTDPARNESFFLLLGAELVDRDCGAQVLHVEGQAPRAADLGDLFREDDGFEKAEAVAAVFLRQGAAEEALLGHLLDHFGAEPVIRFVVLEGRQDLLGGEVLRHVLHHLLFFRQSEVHLMLLGDRDSVRADGLYHPAKQGAAQVVALSRRGGRHLMACPGRQVNKQMAK